VDVIERVMKFGCEPAIGMKQSWRMRIRNWLRRMSFENWERYRRERYRIEGVFGSMKLKLGSSFTLVREDLAKKMAIACAILWNLYMIILQRLWIFMFMIVLRVYDSIESEKEGIKGLIIFFEQPHFKIAYTFIIF